MTRKVANTESGPGGSLKSTQGNPRTQAAQLVIYWDYDTQWGADRSRSAGGRKQWGHAEFENTERLLELHAAFDIPACFAVVGSAALPGKRPYHDPEQIRRMCRAGHEIASHSFRHEWLPGLDEPALLETLRSSKSAIEDCTGVTVASFVPPFNQPFDYPGGFAFSLSERREAGAERTDLRRLCDALAETGYRSCRVSYKPVPQQLAERLFGRSFLRPGPLATIGSLKCIRLSASGFGRAARRALDVGVMSGGVIAVYGHPHALHAGDVQDEKSVVPFFETVRRLRDLGMIQVSLPRDLVGSSKQASRELPGAREINGSLNPQ